ncbi:hypothetical protein E2C01_017927 [Portunus trituberculatus]|uniref:Uncharacterized protein n=1 Tax=Portunus trituberculatus TaxID=210409 RepID=A0A5B7DV51_PORTR|nr:hypothetical protein [Portunus trituberculatus]
MTRAAFLPPLTATPREMLLPRREVPDYWDTTRTVTSLFRDMVERFGCVMDLLQLYFQSFAPESSLKRLDFFKNNIYFFFIRYFAPQIGRHVAFWGKRRIVVMVVWCSVKES